MITVLYVDADLKMHLLLSRIFEKYAPVSVFPAASGEEALIWLDQYHADVIVSEYDLPGMNGIELLHAVRSQGFQLPFILFSENENVHVKNDAYKGDVFGFILRKGSERKSMMNLLRLIMWAAGNYDTEYSFCHDVQDADTNQDGLMK